MRRLILEIRWQIARFFSDLHIARAKRNVARSHVHTTQMRKINEEIMRMVEGNDRT